MQSTNRVAIVTGASRGSAISFDSIAAILPAPRAHATGFEPVIQ